MKNIITLRNISKSFVQGETVQTLFTDLSAEFEQGVSYAITGISGVGKSTLLSLISGLEQPTSGTILLGERNIESLIQEQPRFFFHKVVGIVFSSANLLRELTVVENVMMKGLISGEAYRDCFKRGYELLEDIHLQHKAHALPATLSAGEQQRVSIARALFCSPYFLLADEPTAHLDSTNKNMVLEMLADYQRRLAMGLIVTCHDAEVARAMDVCLELGDGLLKKDGIVA